MRNVLYYEPYGGIEPYLFLKFDRADSKAAAEIVNNLIDRQFRTCYSEQDDKRIPDSEWLAERILSAELAVFLISAASLSSLEFRNCVNFALGRKKKVFCVYLDDEKPGYGFDLQLANVPGAKLGSYENAAALCDDMVKNGSFVQEMRSENAKIPIRNNRIRTAATAAIAAILVLSIAIAVPIAVYRVKYENSTAGQIEKLTETNYLDISGEKASMIELLKGKSVRTLVARSMGLTDIGALALVNCEEMDISGNSQVLTLEPLLDNEHLKTVKLTQDMYPAIARLNGSYPFIIVITG